MAFQDAPIGQGSLGCSRGPLGQGHSGEWAMTGGAGVATSRQSVHIQGLVKRAQDHVYNGTSVDSDTWVQGCHCYSPCLSPTD